MTCLTGKSQVMYFNRFELVSGKVKGNGFKETIIFHIISKHMQDPAPLLITVPVKQVGQIPVYEAATRLLINTDQKKSTLSGTDDLRKNADGSVDLYFGPVAPEGFEKNWIKTKSKEGWFTLPRLYAPLEPILNKTWRWNDIEKIN